MKRLTLGLVALAALLVGCASPTPPEAGFGTETVMLAEPVNEAVTSIYLLRAGDSCQFWVKKAVGLMPDIWIPYGEVDCAAALALFGADR